MKIISCLSTTKHKSMPRHLEIYLRSLQQYADQQIFANNEEYKQFCHETLGVKN